jgi:hypothetical protein
MQQHLQTQDYKDRLTNSATMQQQLQTQYYKDRLITNTAMQQHLQTQDYKDRPINSATMQQQLKTQYYRDRLINSTAIQQHLQTQDYKDRLTNSAAMQQQLQTQDYKDKLFNKAEMSSPQPHQIPPQLAPVIPLFRPATMEQPQTQPYNHQPLLTAAALPPQLLNHLPLLAQVPAQEHQKLQQLQQKKTTSRLPQKHIHLHLPTYLRLHLTH